MVYFIDRGKPKKKVERQRMGHSENGWPHFSGQFPFFCMCLDSCCQGESGCKCRHCVCRIAGISHGEVINDPTLQRKASRQGSLNILAEKEGASKRQVRSVFQRGADKSRQDMRQNTLLR